LNLPNPGSLHMKTRAFILISALIAAFGASAFAPAEQTVRLKDMPVPEAALRSQHLGHTDPNQILHVSINLPLADPDGAQAFADSVSDPSNPNYMHFIEPKEFGQRFGLSSDKVKQVVDYLTAKGLQITLVADSHLNILADCTVAQAESAFQTRIDDFKALDPREKVAGRPKYFAYTAAPAVPASIAPYVAGITGLENFTRPKRKTTLSPSMARTLYKLAATYTTYKGTGRTVGISNFDGFRLTNIPIFYNSFALPSPPGGVGSNIQVVTINGGSGAGTPAGEGDLDIQMVLGQAPFCNLIVYDDGTDLVSCLTREAQDNKADIITESYGWNPNLTDTNAAHNIHLQMTAQGITYLLASGDAGTDFLGFDYADYDPEITNVGGTEATTDAAGNRISEIGWFGSGGGWSLVPATYNKLPTWQKGNGVPANINARLVPDMAVQADSATGGFFMIFNGTKAGVSGTSCSSPLCAGALADVEQREIAKGTMVISGGKFRAGRINDLIYSQNGKSTIWTDIVTGSNGTLPNGSTSSAHPGWDFVTGWGSPIWDAFSFVRGIGLIDSLTSLGVLEGTPVSGDAVGSTGNTDGVFFSIRPATEANIGMAGSVAYRTVLPPNIGRSQVLEFDVTVAGKFATNATGQIYLFNYSTGKYDIAKSFPMGATVTTSTFSLKSSFSNYISAAGESRVMVRGLLPTWAGVTSNFVSLDKVQLQTIYQAL